ncbi:MAG: hypothetical protein V4692_09435 [Bdellovibrionota bacterium]
MIRKAVIATSMFAALGLPQLAVASKAWNITKTSWSETDERNYSSFVQTLGESGCRTVNACLKSPANPYRGTDSPNASFWADCGRYPYLLRAYFAWKNGLPFSIVSGVAAVEGLGDALQYSPKGNYVTARKDVVQRDANVAVDGYSTVNSLTKSVFSAMFRYNAELDKPDGKFYDLYPVSIDRKEIRPGTVIYDANGHIAVVYRVETDGRVRFFDSHPDQSVTRSVYGEKFARSNPFSGAGFKNFRPITLTGATRTANGNYIGGRVTTVPMTQIPGFSLEYFYGTAANPSKAWRQAKFVLAGQTLPYYDFVRSRLAVGELKYQPVTEMLNYMDTLCNDIKERVQAVDGAINAGINLKAQPFALPNNIYGTSGEWEEFSTPSRDARLKTSFVELNTEVQKFVSLYRAGSSRVIYSGTDLIGDLRSAYEKAAESCEVGYRRTDGSVATLTFHHVAARIWDLSFDPYHCVERRWGATDTDELSTCKDGSQKDAWYQAERRLRNQIERTYDAKMGFTLEQLQSKAAGSGVDAPPDADLRRYLYSN